MNIYVASSWRCPRQPVVVEALRAAGHEVYDFRHPAPGNEGFHWSAIDPAWQSWDGIGFRNALEHSVARDGFALDMNALRACDACVLVLPCGRSAHLELGWAAGAGKRTAVLLTGKDEPELMYRMLGKVCVSVEEIVEWLAGGELRAFGNGYETLAATSEDEAREILRGMEMYDPEDLDGDGWTTLDLAAPMRDEDGKETGETVGDIVRAAGKPGHLWSVEQ